MLAPCVSRSRSNADGFELDEYWLRMGVILREQTPSDTNIAVIGGGNTP